MVPLFSSLSHLLAAEAEGSLTASQIILTEAGLHCGVCVGLVLGVQLHHIGDAQICAAFMTHFLELPRDE